MMEWRMENIISLHTFPCIDFIKVIYSLGISSSQYVLTLTSRIVLTTYQLREAATYRF